MKRLRNGDIVGRISYNKDIFFIIKDITNKNNVILEGVFERIIADSDISDLELIDKKDIVKKQKELEGHLKLEENRNKTVVKTGRILHLDGDKKYSQKSIRYYSRMGINAIVKNIPEYKQPKIVYTLLQYYKPDILVVTGHDGMIKKGYGFYDLYNYRNSKYFVATVKEARRFDRYNNSDLAIFAGACQSYFEALISAGANFASSPARILIDILDPLIVATKLAITENYKYVSIEDLEDNLRDGTRGISGIGANREKERFLNIKARF